MSQSTIMTDSESSRPPPPPLPEVKSESIHDDGPQPKTRHSKYFFNDVPVIFEASIQGERVEGGVLFKVHKHFLERESSVFQTMFSCPPDSTGPEGATENNPIVLPGVKADDFEALLDYFYEPQRGLNDALPANWPLPKNKRKKKVGGSTRHASTTDRLASLLSIATRFDFERPRQFAIEALGQRIHELTPVRRILLARQFEVDPWLKPAYIGLCRRDEPLSIQEAGELGLETTVLMAKARECFVQEKAEERHSRRSRSPPGRRPQPVYAPPQPRSPSPPIWRDPLEAAAERIVSNIFFPMPPPERAGTPMSD